MLTKLPARNISSIYKKPNMTENIGIATGKKNKKQNTRVGIGEETKKWMQPGRRIGILERQNKS